MAAPTHLDHPSAHISAGPAEYPHDALWDALREVEDPELGISVVDMGLIVDARPEGADGPDGTKGATARVTITYTAMGCPATELIEGDIHARLRRVPGVRDVVIEVVWEPVWTKARLTEDGRDALALLGVAI
ncbi:MAG TPA: metal-sulfur cluster assembly factor [Ktedonobacterales bacterium]|jgi:metal-sulfur cluster biosynthetic enzyme|nr:metal-sulfur cluster assembly factor [Ktedonobacterales bacterium]